MTNFGNGANARYQSRMREVANDLVSLASYYRRFSEVDHDGFAFSIMMMLNIELDFADNVTLEGAQRQRDLWDGWAAAFIRQLEDLDMSLDYTPDRQRFQAFLDKVEAARALLLSDPAAVRP